MLGALGHGHSATDEFASQAHSSRQPSDGSNSAKALATPTVVRALHGFYVDRAVATQHATYAIVADQSLVFRMGRDTPHGQVSTASSNGSSAETLDSLLPVPMPALTGMPLAHFAAASNSLACLIRAFPEINLLHFCFIFAFFIDLIWILLDWCFQPRA